MAKIRAARYDDIDKLVEYGEKFYQQTRYIDDGLAYNAEAVETMCTVLMDANDGFILVLTHDEEVIGFIIMVVSPLPYNPEVIMAGELAFYIDEEHRRGKLGMTLLQQAETIAKINFGADYVAMVSMEDCYPRQAEALYEQLGYTRTETTYSKEV